MAYGAIKGLKELNLIDKISIIGFDNINISNYITPRLTSINPPIDLLADKALKFIINKEKNSIIIDKLEIIKRESVKKIK
ncbi:MAG: LacI family transcriptional regulator [Fusobacteriaceae bacterium]|jgi:LacI family transcriptional regulator|nr:LacI family transcriptional regulator [Fusobacteriaceae bacterium]